MDFPGPPDIQKLCDCLYSDSSEMLQKTVNNIIIQKIHCENAFILFLSENHKELYCEILGDSLVLPEDIRFEVESSSFHNAVTKKTSVIVNNVEDFSMGHNSSCSTIKSFLCVPLLNPKEEDTIVGLLCLINKESFTVEDLELIEKLAKYVSPLLIRSRLWEKEHKKQEQSQALLQIVKTLLIKLDDVNNLLREIMSEAKSLTGAERCSLFLLDKEENMLVSKVFDLSDSEKMGEEDQEVSIPATEGIAGCVAMSGEILNISDVYSHPLFYSKVDEETGFKTRNMLCFPIKDNNDVIGVAELCNKTNGSHFTQFDEEIASTFAVYCAVCIMHSLSWKKVRDNESRTSISYGLVTQTKISEEEVLHLLNKANEKYSIDEKFQSFEFIPRVLSEDEAAHATLGMFEDLGFIQAWKIRKNTLIRFVAAVKQGYRKPPYHNWMHGFSVGHFSYLLLKNLKLMGNQLSFLEGLSLFVACLCHDLDHKGTTSSFQVTSKSVLAALYSSEGSVLERHHFAQTVGILHTVGCNIFENLSGQDYQKCLDYIRKIILATDLARHFRIIGDIEKILKDGYDNSNSNHHQILLSLIVTSCDLSDQTKDWGNTKEIAKLIYREFFKQGDLEKALGVKPNEMMDREHAQIPQLQISFLNQVVLPVYKLLSGFFPDLSFIVKNIETRKKQWEQVDKVFEEELPKSKLTPLEFLDDDRVDEAALSVQ